MNYPVELTPPDLEPYRKGNTGVEYVTTFDSGKAGPNVMLNALTHGNELCGAIALDFLFRNAVRPKRGRLTLAFANIAAYRSFDRHNPSDARYVEEDFNRVWTKEVLEGKRSSVELRRARELRPVVESADYLLDIHSMHHAISPLMMCGLSQKSVALARRLGLPEWLICDAGHRAGRRMRDYGEFGDEASPRTALLIECGQHWQRASADVAIDVSLRFLVELNVISAETAAPLFRGALPAKQRTIEVTEAVTIETDGFRFASTYRGMEIIESAGTVIAKDGGREVTTPYDDCVLIMPGVRLKRGDTAVRLGRIVG